jgi:hypothetical protein
MHPGDKPHDAMRLPCSEMYPNCSVKTRNRDYCAFLTCSPSLFNPRLQRHDFRGRLSR